jgi:beta-glucanase (GH16 family)
MYKRSFILFISLFLFASVKAQISKPPVPGDWALTLNEDFNSFDEATWNTKLETPKKTYRRSNCFFLKRNVFTEDGHLVLITKREKLKLKDESGEVRKLKYSSGLVNSFKKFRQKYGYFEARIKLPSGRGLWPAFWLMPDRTIDVDIPFEKGMRSTRIIAESDKFLTGKGMEIDIMEYLTEWNRQKFHMAAHWDGYGKELTSYRTFHKPERKFSDDFHKYAVYWDEGIIVWYFDDKEVFKLESPRVCDVPMYLILSTNVGGWATWRVERDKLPEQTLIDYVRVWQKNIN